MADASNGGGRIVPIVRPEEDALQPCPQPPPSQKSQQEPQGLQQPKASKKMRNKLFETAESLEIPCLNQLGLYALPTEGDGN